MRRAPGYFPLPHTLQHVSALPYGARQGKRIVVDSLLFLLDVCGVVMLPFTRICAILRPSQENSRVGLVGIENPVSLPAIALG